VLKQLTMALTAAMVLASVATTTAAAEGDRRVDELHQHQGVGPGGVPGPHHHQPAGKPRG
jgi:hypothetical protein